MGGELGTADQPGLGSQSEIGRRGAIKLMGGAAVASRLALPPSRSLSSTRARLGAQHPALPSATPSLIVEALRPQDMINLRFEFYNAERSVTSGQTYIVPTDASQPSFMVIYFPAQHLGEQVVDYPVKKWPTSRRGALAGNSWLAFQLPANAAIPYTFSGLLSWASMTPQLVPVVSDLTAAGAPAAPDPMHTALEVPWSLWLSPPADGTWQHSVTPVDFGGRTELWHTRLGINGVEPPVSAPQIVAFWSRTYGLSELPADPFQMSLTPQDRNDIVALTAGGVSGGAPAVANFFALSALGASIDVQARWTLGGNNPIPLQSWIHRTSIGRDSYVRVVTEGYLFPFGNHAVSIAITDREFQVDPAGETLAYLVEKVYIVVTQPVITFTGDPDEPNGGRQNPIRTLEVKTVSTGPIDFNPATDPGIKVGSLTGGFANPPILWVRSNGKDIPFSFVATDIEGRTVDFTASVIWLESTEATEATIPDIISAYGSATSIHDISPSFGGALFAFADTTNADAGSTAQHVGTYTLSAVFASNGAANFYPVLDSAVVHLPGAEQIVGAGSKPLSAPSVSIHPNYVTNGFQSGVTEVYLEVNSHGPALGFPAKLVGGMATPNFQVSGITRDLGPVGGSLTDLINGTFDPTTFFANTGGVAGKLLGAIDIAQIIQKVPDAPSIDTQTPQISSTFVYGNGSGKPPTAIQTMLTWTPEVTANSYFVPNQPDGENTSLLITAQIYTPISNPAATTYAIHGELTNFQLALFGTSADDEYILITFTSFTFDSKTGAKTSIQPQIASVDFEGPLSFIQDLQSLLSSLGGPSVDVTAEGIDASYTLAIPSVGLGIFSLTNLSLSGGVNIPFDGTPVRVRFAISTQDNPFLLSIYVFTGGGFFGLAIGADGIEQIQVELEFGASISINLGVASGGVSIMAGIYYSLQTSPSMQVQLTGFLKADGNLSVLGIITISMEFYLGLTYLDPGQCYGTASVSLSISVLFFSVSVTATYTKTFGGGSDPDFQQAISQADWDTYCEAFAA
jgi:hypothetical protein